MNNLDLIDETIKAVCSEIKYSAIPTEGYANAVAALAKLIEARTKCVNLNLKKESESKELSVRIPLQNIKFKDPYEQYKFEKLKSSNPKEAIKAVEESLKHFSITISYHL